MNLDTENVTETNSIIESEIHTERKNDLLSKNMEELLNELSILLKTILILNSIQWIMASNESRDQDLDNQSSSSTDNNQSISMQVNNNHLIIIIKI